MITTIVFSCWLTITPPIQFVTDSTSVLIAEYWGKVWEPMNESVLNINNYSLYDANDSLQTFKIYKISFIDSLDHLAPAVDSTLIAIQTERLPYGKNFVIKVNDKIENKRGIKIQENKMQDRIKYYGFTDRIKTPVVNIK